MKISTKWNPRISAAAYCRLCFLEKPSDSTLPATKHWVNLENTKLWAQRQLESKKSAT